MFPNPLKDVTVLAFPCILQRISFLRKGSYETCTLVSVDAVETDLSTIRLIYSNDEIDGHE